MKTQLRLLALLAPLLSLPLWADASGPSVSEAAGISTARLQRLDEYLGGLSERAELSGSVAIVLRQGKVVYSKAFGWADIEAGKRMQLDSIVRIFSMTKPIVCTAAMILVEEGRLLLTDPASRYIPGLANPGVYVGMEGERMLTEPIDRPITIRMLATHTAGMAYIPSPGDYPLLSEAYTEADLGNPLQTLEEMADALSVLPLIHQPGTTWDYSISIDFLARVVEVAAGQPFGDFIQQRIFDPLGMHDTGYRVPKRDWDRVATVYAHDADGKLVVAPDNPALRHDDYKFRRHHAGGHGLVSTAGDYARFARMLLNDGVLDGKRVISPASARLMRTDALQSIDRIVPIPGFNRDALGFGLCGSVTREPAHHAALGSVGTYSWSGAASTHFFVDPAQDMVGVLMAQHVPYNPDGLFERFTNLVYQAIVE